MIRMEERSVYHVPVMVNDIAESRAFYQRALGLRHSGTVGLRQDALNVIGREAVCFMSCGDRHHDFAAFQAFDRSFQTLPVTPDEIHHVSFVLRPEHSLADMKRHLASEEIPFTEGPALPDPTGTYDASNCLHFRDPNGHFVEVHAAEE